MAVSVNYGIYCQQWDTTAGPGNALVISHDIHLYQKLAHNMNMYKEFQHTIICKEFQHTI